MIFVFKTSVKTKVQLKKLKPHIDELLPGAIWNFDLEDIDKISRLESDEDVVLSIVNLLIHHNFCCEELK